MTEQQNKALVKDCSKFASKFKSKEEFRKWCEEGTKKDLECALRAFEESEAYEWCTIINEVLKRKDNE